MRWNCFNRFRIIKVIRKLLTLLLFACSLPIEQRADLYVLLLRPLGTQFFQTVQAVLGSGDDEDDGASNSSSSGGGAAARGYDAAARLMVAEALACLVVILPQALRQYVLRGPLPTLPRHLAAPAAAAPAVPAPAAPGAPGAVPVASNAQCLLYVIIRRLISDNDNAVIEQLGDILKVPALSASPLLTHIRAPRSPTPRPRFYWIRSAWRDKTRTNFWACFMTSTYTGSSRPSSSPTSPTASTRPRNSTASILVPARLPQP